MEAAIWPISSFEDNANSSDKFLCSATFVRYFFILSILIIKSDAIISAKATLNIKPNTKNTIKYINLRLPLWILIYNTSFTSSPIISSTKYMLSICSVISENHCEASIEKFKLFALVIISFSYSCITTPVSSTVKW